MEDKKIVKRTRKRFGYPDVRKQFNTPEKRVKLCNKWIEHCMSGLSKEAFRECSYRNFLQLQEEYPEDFDQQKLDRAEREYAYFWQKMGIEGMMGNIRNFNSSVWQWNMANRFGWRPVVDQQQTNQAINIEINYDNIKSIGVSPEPAPNLQTSITAEDMRRIELQSSKEQEID